MDLFQNFPDEREKAKTKTEQSHFVLLRLLRMFDAICKKYDIDYWLDYGTLLGAIRHQGFIPWDYDIDIGMLRLDYELFIQEGIKDLPFDIFFQNKDSDPAIAKYSSIVEARLRDRFSDCLDAYKEYFPLDWHNGIQLDMFIYDKDNKLDDCFTNGYERYVSNRAVHLKFEEIEYLDNAIFEGYEFFIPVGYDKYLKRAYGDYMQLPSMEIQCKLPNHDAFNPCNHPESLKWADRHKYINT